MWSFLSILKEEGMSVHEGRIKIQPNKSQLIINWSPHSFPKPISARFQVNLHTPTMMVHVSDARLAFRTRRAISAVDSSIKPVYKLPARPNVHLNQLIQYGLQMQRSNCLCTIATASVAGSAVWIRTVGPRWCSIKRHKWTSGVGAAACLHLRQHALPSAQWDIIDYSSFLLKESNNHLKPSSRICAAPAGIQNGTIWRAITS